MDLSKLAANAKLFNDNIKFFEAQAVQESEKELVDLNRSQMLDSKTSEGKAFVNSSTGKNTLSLAYAKRTGKSKPDLYVDGSFQKDMFLETNENDGTYAINSFWDKTKYLIGMYTKDIFGIAPKNKAKAINVASRNFLNIYKNIVWRI